jgi:hypothetical protein
VGYQTLWTRHSIKETAPRLMIGLLAGGPSLWVATKAIHIANALVRTVMTGGVDTSDPIVVPSEARLDSICALFVALRSGRASQRYAPCGTTSRPASRTGWLDKPATLPCVRRQRCTTRASEFQGPLG